MIKPVESNEEIDEAIRWFFVTLEARDVDYMSGTIKKITWNDVKSLVGYEPTWIPTRDLAAYCFQADSEYQRYIQKQRESQNPK